ncbi:MAG: flagellar biosynthesis protein FlgA [Candidatus Dormibacteraeota bacterium]|nr:flagellar biosynthesis protein FlgA [Candidatus Dormibacteraeota bacterium]
MSLWTLLGRRVAESGPVRVGVIGAGKFASMYLAQARDLAGIHVVGVADLRPERARAALQRTAWPEERFSAGSMEEALRTGGTHVTDRGDVVIEAPGVEVIVEVTGDPLAGAVHASRAIDAGRHVVMVNVEADSLVGPALAERAARAGVVYSMAYGDQPALICELVDWARTSGFEVVAAGKGTKYLPSYHQSTPDTVWDHFGFTAEQVATGDYNPQMFNSFLDGTKSAIEMAAVANATRLVPQEQGLGFPPAGVDELASVLRPPEMGGTLGHRGTVEVVSSLARDGSAVPGDLRWGVYVTFEPRTDYAVRCLTEYAIPTDDTGRIGALYRPSHLIGLELNTSIASAVLRGEPTGVGTGFVGDVMTIAKRGLRAGETLDGEGGFTVYGRLAPASRSLSCDALPIGLARGARLQADVKAGSVIRRQDVAVDEESVAARLRRELETRTARPRATTT